MLALEVENQSAQPTDRTLFLGVPLAWLIASNGTTETLAHYLRLYRAQNPKLPKWFMSDKDHAQMNAVQRVYTVVLLLLCWWHVLHAWQQHFHTRDFPVLWDLLKKWIRIRDEAEFEAARDEIREEAPPSFNDYLDTYWMNCERQFLTYLARPDTRTLGIPMWSAIHRKGRHIFEDIDTNMLIEAWHHVLKGKFMDGKRNRRLDQLIYILVREVVPFYKQKQLRQEHGFEGLNLEIKARKAAIAKGEAIPKTDCIPKVRLHLPIDSRP